MKIDEAARLMYGFVPGGGPELPGMMDFAQGEWNKPGVKDTWRDEAWHAVWWILHALAHDDRKAIEPGKAYLELCKRG